MGICDSSNNKNVLPNNTQTNIQISNNQTSLTQNPTSKLNQNLNSNPNINTNKGFQTQNLVDDDRPSFIDRHVSMGSSVINEDSIGYNQTRNTVDV